MAVFVTRSEMKSLWKPSLGSMIRECKRNRKAPHGLVELIRHNLYAEYVSYDAGTEVYEIGVNESINRAKTYPTIKVYTFSLHELEQKLKTSYKSTRYDLEFYAKILTGKDLSDQVLVL
ncbi:hypothetical protein [Salinimicrobium sp. HB62]|uniref:hypothetical protein n=1 Tax=Salinimicrobium sp. HB62 TaxID=3077781 RepID=UPI002D7A2B84|nr:hypothetical protein [Salinimicrobium sp. HB62]